MSRRVKKKLIQMTFAARKRSKPHGVNKQTRLHNRVTLDICDENEEKLPIEAEETPLQEQENQRSNVSGFSLSTPQVNFRYQASQLAAIARDLHKAAKPATNAQISFASKFFIATKMSVDDLKESEYLEDDGAKLGLERIRREITIFQHIGEVSFFLLEEVQLLNNELDVFQKIVISWVGLCRPDPLKPVFYPTEKSRCLSLASAAKALKAYLQARKQAMGFKVWIFSRLKTLAKHADELLHESETEKSKILAVKLPTLSDTKEHFGQTGSQGEPFEYFQVAAFESDVKQPTEIDRPENTEVSQVIHHYTLSLENERSRILNTIMSKQRTLKQIHAEVKQVRAAFNMAQLLPDLQEHVATLHNQEVEWTVEAAGVFGENLQHFGQITKDLVQGGLVKPLAAEKQAEDELENYLKWSPDSAVLAGTNAVLKELVGLRQDMRSDLVDGES
ncbi:hypothetical protein WAI453_006296 [Rhynchosporium graminicola]|uniref:Uncharacterized protein n=1 Tax=Rhynchosporium graminicola TaxID=2792576 RepID=A0A1E1L6V7_9HELO|nr:uncharacterized protein RCO7_03289 [Rhynchosporium commune]